MPTVEKLTLEQFRGSGKVKVLSKEERRQLAEQFAKEDSSEIMRRFNLE